MEGKRDEARQRRITLRAWYLGYDESGSGMKDRQIARRRIIVRHDCLPLGGDAGK
jgi:hypothetical protein